MEQDYLESVKKQFAYYKILGDKTLARLTEEQLCWQYNEESNSINTIVKHLWGNMKSRWTDFLTTDGEKDWRNRDAEFDNDTINKETLLQLWEEGWACLFQALNGLQPGNLNELIYIRNQGHTVMEAINRQLAHYPYHVGQMVFIGKMIQNQNWESLSIAKGTSQNYNAEKFAKEKQRQHFTDELINHTMTKAEIAQQLQTVHAQLWDEACNIPAALQHKSVNGKWSAAQHVEHINKGMGSIARYMGMPKDLLEKKFGLATRESMSPQQLFDKYKIALQNGAVSTPRFEPDPLLQDTMENLAHNGAELLHELLHQLNQWTENELDQYNCPHPVLGELTTREILLFTIFHCTHHHKGMMKVIG